ALRAEQHIPQDAVVVGSIGFDTPLKGFEILFEALRRLLGEGLTVHLLIVGVDPAQSSLPARAVAMGLSGFVHWGGILDEGWQMLSAADVYAQPSLSEGLPLAVMEAMAIGLPVVASRVGGIHEAVVDRETGFLVDPGRVESLLTAF